MQRSDISNRILFVAVALVCVTFFVYSTPQANGMEGLLPKLEPTQHVSSNPNLYVSAENSLFKNYFAGPQVIEVIVSDPDINRLDQAYGEPVVTINGKRLRMAQTTDGNWHAYFADMNQAQYADATQTSNSGKGLDFGQFCSSESAIATGVDFSETKGIAVSRHFSGASNGTQSLGTCSPNNIAGVTNIVGGTLLNHVIKQNTTLNGQPPGGKLGQISSNNIAFSNAWPIIQLYDFSGFPETVTIQYQKAGGVQSVDLVFDRIPGSLIKGLTNRIYLPQGAEVQADLLDPQLNIDPTEEDSWTWGTSTTNSTVYYGAFSRNGIADADGTIGMQDLSGNLTSLMFNHNGILTTNPRPQGVKVVEAQNNGIQTGFLDSSGRHRTQSISGASGPITLLEIQPNVGIFSDYDTKGIADLKIINNAMRDTSFLAKYNDISYSIVVKYHTATLTMEIPHGNVQTQNVQTKVITHNPDTVFISFLKLSIVKSLFLYQFFTTLGFNVMM
ncbi:MAG: hypothetical protein ABI342_04290 [Nitrososphaera sp.]|jgi:hypothetical protein